MNSNFKFINVGSGSKGNASFVLFKDVLIQIDSGLCKKRVENSLQNLGKSLSDIDCLLITHNHSDHVKGIDVCNKQTSIFAAKGSLDFPITKAIKAGDTIDVKGVKIEILKTSHDAPNPVGFLFTLDSFRFAYITDTGILPAQTKKKILNCDLYVFESNHDVEMLENSPRPQILINRILSSKGHLSNVQSAEYLVDLVGPRTKAVYLAHLSEECNTPETALSTHKEIYKENGLEQGFSLDVLWQNKETIYEY